MNISLKNPKTTLTGAAIVLIAILIIFLRKDPSNATIISYLEGLIALLSGSGFVTAKDGTTSTIVTDLPVTAHVPTGENLTVNDQPVVLTQSENPPVSIYPSSGSGMVNYSTMTMRGSVANGQDMQAILASMKNFIIKHDIK